MRYLLVTLLILLVSCAHRRGGTRTCEAYCSEINRVCAGFDYVGSQNYQYRCAKKDSKKE